MDQDSLQGIFGDVIHAYTRAQAIEDGTLVDLTKVAEAVKVGRLPIRFPLACTNAVWEWVNPSEKEINMGQSVAGRLWDMIWMLSLAARRGGDTVLFQVIFLRKPQKGRYRHHTVTLKAVCGPGDCGEPVITIMLPSES